MVVVVVQVVEAVSGMPGGGDNQICRLFAIDIAVDCVCHRGPARPPPPSSGGPCPPSQHRQRDTHESIGELLQPSLTLLMWWLFMLLM